MTEFGLAVVLAVSIVFALLFMGYKAWNLK